MDAERATDLNLEGLVHDLNNVFETISEAADLLAGDPNWAPLSATVHRSVDRGRRILSSYFETTRGSLELETIVESAIAFTLDFVAAIKKPAIEFKLDVEPGLRLVGNGPAWERVFMNLFLNASQIVKKGCRVEVAGRRTAEGIEVTVADNGPGIPPEILPKIFTPRFSTKSDRTGLGLHIVRSIVDRYGGTVTAANREGTAGAVFRIELPAAGQDVSAATS
ncbi:MAG: HAMP domain-containing sensor histidine kinase [Bryobacteraceae bacterium]|nr:HAMP domain-containing sensor histidine kinase [Bryobacteraceae bacterium]